MFRPPVREACVDVLEDLWRNRKFSHYPPALLPAPFTDNPPRTDAEVRGQVQKLIQRFRPDILTQGGMQQPAVVNGGGGNA
jgi:hypothetical protein